MGYERELVTAVGACRWGVFVRLDAGERLKSLSDFSSDIVTRYPAALGVVAASAGCWSPVFTGAE